MYVLYVYYIMILNAFILLEMGGSICLSDNANCPVFVMKFPVFVISSLFQYSDRVHRPIPLKFQP